MLLEFFPLLLILIALAIWFKNHRRRKKQGGGLFFRRGQKAKPAPDPDPFEEKWEMFAKYDPKVRAAIEKVRPAGTGALAQLKSDFKASEDRAKIGELADRIVAQKNWQSDKKKAASAAKPAARAKPTPLTSPPVTAASGARKAPDRAAPSSASGATDAEESEDRRRGGEGAPEASMVAGQAAKNTGE